MGSGASKATPTILRTFKREPTEIKPVPFAIPKPASDPDENENKMIKTISFKDKDDTDAIIMEKEKAHVEDVAKVDVKKGTDETLQQSDEEKPGPDFVKVVYGFANSRWPIYCFGKLDFNVNAQHGGSTALYLNSSPFGGKGNETNSQVSLIRGGFDCNHVSMISVFKDHSGHFGPDNNHKLTEDGQFVAECQFGSNHMMFLTNDSRYGNLRNGMYLSGDENGSAVLPLDINDGGLTMLLCSGVSEGKPVNAVYMVRLGFKDNFFNAKILTGEDKFKFEQNEDHEITVSGTEKAHFGIFHNRMDLKRKLGHAYVAQTQALQGTSPEELVPNLNGNHAFLVLCSNSNGTENCTVSSVYFLNVHDGNLVESKQLCGHFGGSYTTSDLWMFEVKNGSMFVVGPKGPCKYGVLSNMSATVQDLMASSKQNFCLATGELERTKGVVKVTKEDVSGKINKDTDVCIMFNEKVVENISASSLKKDGDSYTFNFAWKEEQKVTGYHIVRVYAVRKHQQSGEDVFLELNGSPFQLTRQKPGVLYALNSGGPAYQAISDVVYSSEHSQFANYSAEFQNGHRFLCLGEIKNQARMPASMLKSQDGFLHVTAHVGDDLKYTINDIPNGRHILRVHLVNMPSRFRVNGEELSSKIKEKIEKSRTKGDLEGVTCYVADVDVNISDEKLVLSSEKICGFALLDKSYKDESLSESQIEAEEKERSHLVNTVKPLSTSTTRKDMEIVGWSPNLLQNSSGQMGNMAHWNVSGDFNISSGGYGTEKMFVTSHMWCEKSQDVNLLDHFPAEYLDTAPEIQVLEWYREGCIGGGFYCFSVSLLSENGQVIKEYSTGEIGTIYKQNEWHEATVTFSNYGPGVRTVAFSSRGKDDKYWGGHYGSMMSAASVRVRRDAKAAEDDAFMDLDLKTDEVTNRKTVDKLIAKVLLDNRDILEDSIESDLIPVDENFERRTRMFSAHHGHAKRRKQGKKREVRVFVSSTFRDFTFEREEIIKKTFRELNKICADRGVFFTYVDLRWGITSEQTNDGKTIAICLQEIDHCRPYFICLMGDRFGWSQRAEETDQLLDHSFTYAIEHNPNLNWIDQYRMNTSVTQLEIFHGALNKPEVNRERKFFYIRDEQNPADFTEDQFKRLQPESGWHKSHQDWLKSEVKKVMGDRVQTFHTPQDVAGCIKKDMLVCIDEDFPKGTELTKLEQQREAHAAFAAARSRVYIGREEYFTTIDEQRLKAEPKPFVVLGESGSGKSSLIVNWVKRVEEAEPDTFMFVHFIGSSADSASYTKLLRRLYEEMKNYYNLNMQIPSSDFLLVNELPKWLYLAGTMSKVVIVLDALNQLDEGEGPEGAEHELQWLPKVVPHNVFILLSTLPGKAMSACQDQGWPMMKVEPLDNSQKEEIIVGYLQRIYGKTLNTEQKEMLVNASQTSNPLYLKALLDEVRMYGSFRTLTNKIVEYLKASDTGELFSKVLDRLEEDFEKGENSREGMVEVTATAIWCSHKGMSEAELVELLGVPSAVWSPFYLSLYESLINRNGLLNFSHDHLRQAVERKYLSTPEAKKAGYIKLAEFFEAREISDRKAEELPFLWCRAGDKEKLKATVSDFNIFYTLANSEDGMFELISAWKDLGGFEQSTEVYMSELDKIPKEEKISNEEYYCNLYSLLGNFFLTLGLMEAAKTIYVTLVEQLEHYHAENYSTIVFDHNRQSWRYRCNHPDVIKSLHELGTVYGNLGLYDKAVSVYQDAISRQNRIKTPTQKLQLCAGLLGLAIIYTYKEDMAEAKTLMIRALELATSVLGKDHHYVATILNKLGQLSYKQGRIEEALAYFLQDLKVTRSEVGTFHPRCAAVLNEIGLVYDDRNDVIAGEFYESALRIILETFGDNYLGTAVIRYNLGAFYFGTNHFAMAKYQFAESYRVHKSFLGDEHLDTISIKKALDTVSIMVK